MAVCLVVKLLGHKVDICSASVDAAVFRTDQTSLCSHEHGSDFTFFTSSPVLTVVSHSNVLCRVGCEVISHYGFILCSFEDY